MSTLFSSPHLSLSTPKSSKFLPYKSLLQFLNLNFCSLKPPLHHTNTCSTKFARTFYKFPKSIFAVDSQLSDEHDEEEEEEDNDYADDGDDIAADEYDAVRGEVSEEEEEEEIVTSSSKESKYEEFKWQRIERIRNEVKEFGDQILDVDELASIYPFRIDKFQVLTYLFVFSLIISLTFSNCCMCITSVAIIVRVNKRDGVNKLSLNLCLVIIIRAYLK